MDDDEALYAKQYYFCLMNSLSIKGLPASPSKRCKSTVLINSISFLFSWFFHLPFGWARVGMSHPRIEISDISADISAIYRISGLIETIFDTENRLQEKSRKIGEYRRYFGEISDFDRNIGRNIGGWETRVRGNFFGFFWEIYRRYIGNIEDISEIYRKYR